MGIQVTKPNKNKGGQIRHWAEEARVWTWYRDIKSKCDLSDHELDYMFAWTIKADQYDDTDNRPRTFEWICKEARQRRGVIGKWRSITELVDAVEQDDRFRGTKKLYHSYFWTLLQSKVHAPEEVIDEIDFLIEEYQLVRIDPQNSATLSRLIVKHGKASVFDRCLRLSIKNIDQHAAITIVWLIHLIARSPEVYYVKESTEIIFDKSVDEFFRMYFEDKLHLKYYTQACNVFTNATIDSSSSKYNGYGYEAPMSESILLPIGLLNHLSEEVVFPKI